MSSIWGLLSGAFFICAAAFLATPTKTVSEPQHHVITQDLGGNPYEFMERYAAQRHRGDTFEIDGICFSACTLILAEIPADHVCVTSYARLGFHSAWTEDENGKRMFVEEATRVIWSAYPQNVRALLQKHGWSGPNVDQQQPIMIEGAELLSIYKACP